MDTCLIRWFDANDEPPGSSFVVAMMSWCSAPYLDLENRWHADMNEDEGMMRKIWRLLQNGFQADFWVTFEMSICNRCLKQGVISANSCLFVCVANDKKIISD